MTRATVATRRQAAFALAAMLAAAALGRVLRPERRLADERPKVELEQMFPRQFGDWAVDEQQPAQLVSPDTQALLDRLYNQVLARLYVDRRSGERVMLSVAYGGDQDDGTRAHRPEVCYPAQGFEVIANREHRLATASHAIRVRQLVARLGGRVEPISYWVTVGDRIALSGTEQKLAQMRYGLAGVVADGLLVRISNLDRDAERSYALHQRFVTALTGAMTPAVLARIVGRPDA